MLTPDRLLRIVIEMIFVLLGALVVCGSVLPDGFFSTGGRGRG